MGETPSPGQRAFYWTGFRALTLTLGLVAMEIKVIVESEYFPDGLPTQPSIDYPSITVLSSLINILLTLFPHGANLVKMC